MEFIGLEIKIIDSENEILKNKKGKIVDETKNTFIIESDGVRKSLLKFQIKFQFTFKGTKYIIDGKKICFRPEERIKKIKI